MRYLCLFYLITLFGVLAECEASGGNGGEVIASNSAEQINKSATVDEVVKQIKKGMTEDAVDEILRPVVVASANGGFGGGNYANFTKYYELKGHKELLINFLGGVISVGKIKPLSKWRFLFFRSDEKELSAAIEIAVRHMNKLIAKEEDLSVLFRLSQRSCFVTLDLERTVNLHSGDGQEIAYKVTAKGTYSTHRLVELYFRINDDWKYHVIVDMTDRAVVPSCWEPTLTDIAKARKIADPSIAELLRPTLGPPKLCEVKVSYWAYYDYGPTRRILELSYHRKAVDGSTQESKRVKVDLENSTLVQ